MLCMSFCEVLIILKAVGGRGEEEQASSASGLLANFATHASVSASHQGCAQKWFLQWAACFFLCHLQLAKFPLSPAFTHTNI